MIAHKISDYINVVFEMISESQSRQCRKYHIRKHFRIHESDVIAEPGKMSQPLVLPPHPSLLTRLPFLVAGHSAAAAAAIGNEVIRCVVVVVVNARREEASPVPAEKPARPDRPQMQATHYTVPVQQCLVSRQCPTTSHADNTLT